MTLFVAVDMRFLIEWMNKKNNFIENENNFHCTVLIATIWTKEKIDSKPKSYSKKQKQNKAKQISHPKIKRT